MPEMASIPFRHRSSLLSMRRRLERKNRSLSGI
jgi:hypothetical protein